jgi:hypothetical protein
MSRRRGDAARTVRRRRGGFGFGLGCPGRARELAASPSGFGGQPVAR